MRARYQPVEIVGQQKNKAENLDLNDEKSLCRHKLNIFPDSNRLCFCSAANQGYKSPWAMANYAKSSGIPWRYRLRAENFFYRLCVFPCGVVVLSTTP